MEAHLETCADCRAGLGETVRASAPEVSAALDAVWLRIAEAAPAAPAPARAAWRWRRAWAPPALGPWIGTGLVVAALAFLIDLAATTPGVPSLVLLVAPVAPLFGVAAAWARRFDPMHELTAATPGAGLPLVLRRTAAVLAVVIPALALAGWATGLSPALWLLPCLAFSTGTLALGSLVGVGRAATALGLAWTGFVITPALATRVTTPLLGPDWLPAWAAAAAVAVAVVAVRARAFADQASRS
ncbi:zf-HC2 domain-containing protein [Actinokineospora sp. G85]|uniref:zf-HC2 domain-containing protein n=1 Tax=Actinokineospora sp. G85 TaxID=3406626 RepID=UPI003C72627B